MILRIVHPDQLQRFIPELSTLFGDFLKRAREPFTVDHLWQALLAGLAQGDRFLFLVAFDGRIRPVGYALCLSGMDFWGVSYANIIQTYAKPGVKVVPDLFRAIKEWAQTQDVHLLSLLTHRESPGYRKFAGRFGFVPMSVMYTRLLSEVTDLEQTATHPAPSDERAPTGVHAVRQPTDPVSLGPPQSVDHQPIPIESAGTVLRDARHTGRTRHGRAARAADGKRRVLRTRTELPSGSA